MKTYFRLQKMEDDPMITAESHPQFLYLLESSLLLALKERTLLNDFEYRYAFQRLRKQYHLREEP